MDNLDMDVKRARAAGLSYGVWKATHQKTEAANLTLIAQAKQEYEDHNAGLRRAAEERRKTAVCPYCGKPFQRTQKNKTYCSEECHRAAATMRIRTRKPPKKPESPALHISYGPEKECAWCGKKFRSSQKRRKYCCTECSEAAQKMREHEQWLRKKERNAKSRT